jgi:hypothetical protein
MVDAIELGSTLIASMVIVTILDQRQVHDTIRHADSVRLLRMDFHAEGIHVKFCGSFKIVR